MCITVYVVIVLGRDPALRFAIGRASRPRYTSWLKLPTRRDCSGRSIRRRQSRRTNFPFNGAGELVLRHLEIVRGLKIQPKARAGIEVPSQPQSRIGSNAAAL